MAVDGNGKAPLPSQLYATLNRQRYSGNKQGPIFPVPPPDLDSPIGSFLPALMLAGYSLRPA